MKKSYLFIFIFLLLLLLQSCISAPPYVPESYLSSGEILVRPQLNKDFTTPMHKFVELVIFNNSKEWVRVDDFKIELEEGTNAKILTDQKQIEEWSFLRSSEVVKNAGRNQSAISSLFSLFGLGVAIVELGRNSGSDESSFFFAAAEEMDYHSSLKRDLKIQKIDRDLSNDQVGNEFELPPGRSTTRWFVINTPETRVPKKIRLSYKAFGTISKYEKPYNMEFNTL